MIKICIFVSSTFILSGCHLYGGLGIHDTSFDSEFKEKGAIATFGISQELGSNVEVFVEHSSMPYVDETKTERGGYGINQAGVRGRWKIF